MGLPFNEDERRMLVLNHTAKAEPRANRYVTDNLLRNVTQIDDDQAESAALQKHVCDLERLLKGS